jgi:hypothetical protein
MERAPDYQPFYCEENVWRLCQHPRLAASQGLVALITGQPQAQRPSRCALFHQRLAAHPGAAVLWDFHVVLFARAPEQEWQAWDLDSDLGAPLPAAAYLAATFGDQASLPQRWRPVVRLIEAARYVAGLRSDRSHMRDRYGRWLQPPPPWPPPGGGGEHNLDRLLDPADGLLGPVADLDGLRGRLGLGPGA